MREKGPNACLALHYPIPPDWTAARFNDARWPAAIVWPASAVTNQRAYTDYTKLFGDAEIHLDPEPAARQSRCWRDTRREARANDDAVGALSGSC